jgi:hypothetical protein
MYIKIDLFFIFLLAMINHMISIVDIKWMGMSLCITHRVKRCLASLTNKKRGTRGISSYKFIKAIEYVKRFLKKEEECIWLADHLKKECNGGRW